MNLTSTLRDSALLQRPRSWVAHMTDRTAVSLDSAMASTTTATSTSTSPSHKRTDSKTLKEDPPPRSCCACTGTEGPFIQPCRCCNADYCVDCLHSMFTSAVEDATRMPPKCCHFFQIHAIIRELSKEEADAYRAAFEEWLAPTKLYCPSPTCSVFIPERVIPVLHWKDRDPKSALIQILEDVFETLMASPSSRFFRGAVPIHQLPHYNAVVKQPMYAPMLRDGSLRCEIVVRQTSEDQANAILPLVRHLGEIQIRLDNRLYSTLTDFTDDIKLILTNSRKYNGPEHPITKAAEDFYSEYFQQVSSITERLLVTPPQPPPPTLFPCPKCHMAICLKCKQIEHSSIPCDNSAELEEIAMLKKFNYKRCPRCRNAVKKMYGCSHIACRCGAHWCWRCEQSLEECDGGCADDPDVEDDDDDDEDDGDYDDDEAARLEREELANRRVVLNAERAAEVAAMGPDALPSTAGIPQGGDATGQPSDSPTTSFTSAPTSTAETSAIVLAFLPLSPLIPFTTSPANPPSVAPRIVNLDAGGGRRWHGGPEDFGAEPEDDGRPQVWSCYHNFETFKPYTDDFDHGDLTRMECNRCFARVEAGNAEGVKVPVVVPKKRRRLWHVRQRVVGEVVAQEVNGIGVGVDGVKKEDEAWECGRCRLLVCLGCKEKFCKELAGRE